MTITKKDLIDLLSGYPDDEKIYVCYPDSSEITTCIYTETQILEEANEHLLQDDSEFTDVEDAMQFLYEQTNDRYLELD